MAQQILPPHEFELHLFCPDRLHFLSLVTWSELGPTLDFMHKQLGSGHTPGGRRAACRWDPGVQYRYCCLYSMGLPVPLSALWGCRRHLNMPFLSTPQLPQLDPKHPLPFMLQGCPSGACEWGEDL